MYKDEGKTVCWHGVEVEPGPGGKWQHKQSKTPCDDPNPFDTPRKK
jgi:hypothetical protein